MKKELVAIVDKYKLVQVEQFRDMHTFNCLLFKNSLVHFKYIEHIPDCIMLEVRERGSAVTTVVELEDLLQCTIEQFKENIDIAYEAKKSIDNVKSVERQEDGDEILKSIGL